MDQNYSRQRILRRHAPFAAAAALPYVLIPLPGTNWDFGLVAIAGVATIAVLALAVLTPWQRLPAAAQLCPGLLYLLTVVILREAGEGSGAGVGPLVLLPVIWQALYGTRGQLGVMLVGVATVFIAPIVLIGGEAYPASGWRLGLLQAAVAAIIGFTVQRLVRRVRDQVAERGELLGRLEELALSDSLTGLGNRRAWDVELDRAVAGATRRGESLCVVLLDVDHLKAVNDLYGHDGGDRLLRALAASWGDGLRTIDSLARLGGDEFGLLLPCCALDAALAVVDRLRAATGALCPWSAGLAQWDGYETAAELTRRADLALYEAKSEGRDRTAVASPHDPIRVATGSRPVG